MKKNIFLPALILLVLFACSKPPVDEINKAIDALNRAENDYEAVTYAGGSLNLARDALNKMREESDSKRYDSAKIYADDVINYSERAIAEGRASAARARQEAAALIESLRRPIAETEAALATARSNNVSVDFNDLDRRLRSAAAEYELAEQALQSNNFPLTLEKGQTVRSILSGINSDISSAAQEMSTKR